MSIPSDVSPQLQKQVEVLSVKDRQHARFGRGETYFLMRKGGSPTTVEKERELVFDGSLSHVCVTRFGERGSAQCTENNQKFDCRTAQCPACLDLNYDLYPERLRKNRPGSNDERRLSSPIHRRHISTYLFSVRKSAISGCRTCLLLFDGIKQVSGLPPSSFQALEGSFLMNKVEISLKIGEPIYVSVFGMQIEFYSHEGRFNIALPWSLTK
jgi:hypothetical protein